MIRNLAFHRSHSLSFMLQSSFVSPLSLLQKKTYCLLDKIKSSQEKQNNLNFSEQAFEQIVQKSWQAI